MASLDDAAERRHHVLTLVVDRDHHAEGRRVVLQILPAWTSSRIHGITSSRTSSSEVVASKPRSSRALLVSGTRICTSCSYGGSDTSAPAFSPPRPLPHT